MARMRRQRFALRNGSDLSAARRGKSGPEALGAPVEPGDDIANRRYWPQTLDPVVQTNGTTTPVKQVV